MGSFPSAANELNTQQPSPLETYGKVMQLKSLMQGQQLQQQQLAGEQQQQQQRAQLFPSQLSQEQAVAQQAQNKLASQNAIIKAWSDPNFAKQITGNQQQSANGPGFDPNAMMSTLMSGKYGKVLPEDAQGIVSGFLDRSVKASEYVKNNAQAASEQFGTYQKSLGMVTDKLSSILSMPASQALPAFDAYKQELAKNPPPGIPANDLQALQGSTLDKLPPLINMATIEGNIAAHHKAEADAAAAQQKVIPPGGGLSPEAQQGLTADIAKETNPQVIQARAQQAAETARIVEPLRQQILMQFQNNKDARDKIETNVLKPYQDKMTEINELQSAVSQAQAGNIAAARATLYKVIGVAQPEGTHRVAPTEVTGFTDMGSIPQRMAGSIANALSGDPWTPQMVQDIQAFGASQAQAAKTSLGQGIDNVNKLFDTSVGQGLKGGSAPTSGFKPF